MSAACWLKLNVGGKIFETWKHTLESCKKLELSPANDGSAIPLDRDPTIFARALKVLRGYPCAWALQDDDVLHELTCLDHDFVRTPLPRWMDGCEKHFEDIEAAIHTLDPEQSKQYGKTHVLIPVTVIRRLMKTDILPSSQRGGGGGISDDNSSSSSDDDVDNNECSSNTDSVECHPRCRVVGAEAEWEDCCWVREKHWDLAKTKQRFVIHFNL
jgi:hypothetical protein